MIGSIVYCLSSDSSNSRFVNYLHLSVRSLRHWHPEARVYLLVDQVTRERLEDGLVSEMDRLNVQVVVADCPHQDVRYRSRFLKTQMPELVALKGETLYLDLDTIILGRLDDLTLEGCPVSIADEVTGMRSLPERPHIPLWLVEYYARLGWDYHGDRYFNSGVMLFDDSKGACEFFKRWHQLWKEQVCAFDSHIDQPSLAMAVQETGITVGRLSHRFNAMVTPRPELARESLIVHYWTVDCVTRHGYDRLASRAAAGKSIDFDALARRHHQGNLDPDWWWTVQRRLASIKKGMSRLPHPIVRDVVLRLREKLGGKR